MKYKPGKGRKPRRQQKVWCRKIGGPKYMLTGNPIAPRSAFFSEFQHALTQMSMTHFLLTKMGFRVQGR